MTVSLARYDTAKRALAAAHSFDEIKGIHDKATALLAYAKQAGDLTLQNQAAEIRILSERRAGQLLSEMAKNPGRRGEGRPRKDGSKFTRSKKTTAYPPKLSDLGITRDQSSKWQRLARLIDDATFEEALRRAKDAYGELTTAGVLRMVKEVVRPKSTRTEQNINEVADGLIREIEARHGRLNAVVKDKERLNPTLRNKLITALQREGAMAQKLSSGFRNFENSGKAYQRIVRERLAQLPEPDIEEKKQVASSLKEATIREISYQDARGLILQNEWMASVGSAEFFYGLYFGKHLGGVVAFGSVGGTRVTDGVDPDFETSE
jgi:hypothetical protein